MLDAMNPVKTIAITLAGVLIFGAGFFISSSDIKPEYRIVITNKQHQEVARAQMPGEY